MESFSLITWLIDRLGLPGAWGREDLHVTMAFLVAVFLTVISLIVSRKLKYPEAHLLPDGRTTLLGVLDVTVGAIERLLVDVLGPAGRRHFPLVGTLFLYTLVSNLLGVIPGFVPPTQNINTNLACALVVFLYYNYYGIKTQGLRRYLRHMGGPVLWLAPLLFFIELLSHLVRPVSLSVRLMGNIVGDHLVLGMFSAIEPLLLPIIFMALAVFVSFMQAFVFTLLTIVYIQMATQTEEH